MQLIDKHPAIGFLCRIAPNCAHPVACNYTGQAVSIEAVWQLQGGSLGFTVLTTSKDVQIQGLFCNDLTYGDGQGRSLCEKIWGGLR